MGGWVEKVSKAKKKKKKLGGGRGKKIPKKNKIEIRAEKGQRKKANQGWHKDRKEDSITASSIHVGWCTSGCWFILASSLFLLVRRSTISHPHI
jgi:hypothetical protein